MHLISKYINRPFLKIDSTQLTAPSYVGRDIEQYLWQLYEDCGKNKELAERAIIYFDEIDKKGSPKKSDSDGKSVQNALLKFIEGTEYIASKNPQLVTENTSVSIKTDNMIVVASGAFLDVYQSKDKKGKLSSLGFNTQKEDSTDLKVEHNEEPSIKDFADIGNMATELMERLPIIIHLRDLNASDLANIMLNSDSSSLKQQKNVFSKREVKLSTKEGSILSIAEQAYERKIGARGLNKLIADSTWQAYEEVCCAPPNTYEEVIITEETATDSSKYQLIKKQTSPKVKFKSMSN